MKLVLSIVLGATFLASAAMACPDLAGNYMCQSSEGNEYMDVTQKEVNGVTVYTINGDEMITDGKVHKINDSTLNGTYTASCSGNAVVTNLKGSGQGLTIDVTARVTKPRASVMKIQQEGTMSFNGQTQPVNENLHCEKI